MDILNALLNRSSMHGIKNANSITERIIGVEASLGALYCALCWGMTQDSLLNKFTKTTDGGGRPQYPMGLRLSRYTRYYNHWYFHFLSSQSPRITHLHETVMKKIGLRKCELQIWFTNFLFCCLLLIRHFHGNSDLSQISA